MPDLPAPTAREILDEVVRRQKRGEPAGIPSICSANRFVLQTCLSHAKQREAPALIEATCNQVNQFGGYMGMTPTGFIAYLREIAAQANFPLERLVIGGDHLGPFPWQGEPAAQAMVKARALARECVLAGYTKLHLDASMRLGDDDPLAPLPLEVAASRAAELALAAESAAGERIGELRYVVGTEVPTPGGMLSGDEQEGEAGPLPGRVTEVVDTLEATRRAFARRGLEAAWERVMAVVVQPGVEFGEERVYPYRHGRAAELSGFIRNQARLVYEAHSTDYQTGEALRCLVEDGFAILKVGPALTYALREALFALEAIEVELFGEEGAERRSHLGEALEAAMLANPSHWKKYARGDATQQRLSRRFGLSDRARYYWAEPQVAGAMERLLGNFSEKPIPLTLLSQYFAQEYPRVRAGRVPNRAQDLITARINRVLDDYASACHPA